MVGSGWVCGLRCKGCRKLQKHVIIVLTLPCNIDGYMACGFLSVHCLHGMSHYNGHGFNFGNFISHYRHLMSDKSPERVCLTGDVIISNDCKVEIVLLLSNRVNGVNF